MADNNSETRVGLYADLRNKIDHMDTLSFDDPNRDAKYGLNGKAGTQDQIPIIHEESMNPEQLSDGHIKKNTLSISIEDLIKQNDDYTMAIEKKELDKKYRSVKKKQRAESGKRRWIIIAFICLGAALVIALLFLFLHIGGVL